MSHRYPHQDDSDENGFGESLQQSSTAQPHDADGSDDDVFQESETHNNVETTEDDEDDEDDPNYEEDDDDGQDAEFYGSCCLLAPASALITMCRGLTISAPTRRCRARIRRGGSI